MRKLLLPFLVAFSLHSSAQVKEGTVKYKTVLSSSDGMAMSALTANSTMTIYFKDDRSLTEVVTPIYTMRTLTDSKGSLMLMDGTGEKAFARRGPDNPTKNKAIGAMGPVITITKETKKILGYDCTKATVVTKDAKGAGSLLVIWYTDKIRCAAVSGFVNAEISKKINGLPLEITTEQGPVKSQITATQLSVKPVADAVFNLSTAGYTEKKVLPKSKY